MAFLAVTSMGRAYSDPADIFSLGAPAITDSAPAASEIAVGDTSVATQTGSLNYAFPIHVPPGRGGMQPSLGLAYSSQGSVYGGVAAGWSLSGIPMISLDTSRGRLLPTREFTSSLAGGRPLIAVTEPAAAGASAFRAQGDGGFVRYEKMPAGSGFPWRAFSPEGLSFVFGAPDHVGSCTIVSDEYAPLTTSSDAFGNQVDYFYEAGVDGECRISQISWGQNDVAELGAFASVRFTYAAPASCAGAFVGAQTSYRTGIKIVTGASQLDSVTVVSFAPVAWTNTTVAPPQPVPLHTRTISLGYSSATASCTASHAAYRALLSIQESAVGEAAPIVTLPPIEFAYGSADVSYPLGNVVSKSWLGTAQEQGFNLGWGYRFSGSNQWPTVEAMMIDIDGDGLIDRLTNEPFLDDQGHARMCRARWERNTGGANQFVDAGYLNMPTLKWATPSGHVGGVYFGGATARSNLSTGANELCALNYQRTGYLNSADGGLASTCRPGGGACPDSGYCANGNDCDPIKTGAETNTIFAWRWFDINGDSRPDLVGSPIKGGLYSYDLQWGPGVSGDVFGAPVEPPIFGSYPLTSTWPCPTTSHTAFPEDANQPYTMCNGLFPWFVYLNHGNGSFGRGRPILPPTDGGGGAPTHGTWGPLPDQIMYQPIPLETAAVDSSITSTPIGQYQGTVDIDGDGYADAVRATESASWDVYRNDGNGQLRPASGTAPYLFSTGFGFSLFRTDLSTDGIPVMVEGLLDVNGDRLVDHWSTCASCPNADINFNSGRAFRLLDGVLTSPPSTNGFSFVAPEDRDGSFIRRGRRIDTRRVLDIDQDGRSDIGRFGTINPTVQVEFNQGGRFSAASPGISLSNYGTGLRREIIAADSIGFPSSYVGSTNPLTWEIRSDMVDLDGDNIPESVDFGSPFTNPHTMITRRVPTPTQPARLLVQIKNNRGATTSIAYGSMNGTAVEQHPELSRAMPHGQWVVQSTTTSDALANTTSTTSYEYINPRFHRDDRGHFGFRGFDEVRTTTPSGARTISRYGYVPDWSGRLITSILEAGSTFDRDDTGPRTISDTQWEVRRLFGNLIQTYHATISDRWICKNGQDEDACRANADTRRRELTTLTALASTTDLTDPTPLLWQATATRLQASETASDGDRTAVTSFALASNASTYRLRPLTMNSFVQTAGASVRFSRTAQTWDATFRVPLTSETWFDELDANRAIERRVFDMTTGNPLERWKPVQNAANTVRTVLQYDARRMFVATEINEVGHVREYEHEYGTGVRLISRGPNAAGCTAATCPSGTLPREEHRIRIDGLGRTLERFATYSEDGAAYTPRTIEMISYVDTRPGGTGPTSFTRQLAVDASATTIRYNQEKTELDGQGRVMRKTLAALGTAPVDHVTTFLYRNDGTLREVTAPDPSANDGRTVSFLYTFDSLARQTQIIRPDATDTAERSRVRTSYDGLSQTVSEFVGAAGGQPAIKTTRNDTFGRLVQIDEQRAASPVTWATTTYSYGADDNLREIVDPDGVTTALRYDLASRRLEVQRGAQIWRTGYDRNGNLTSQTMPGAGPLTQAAFTTTTAYDNLDRISSRSIGQRGLSAADQQRFATGTEVYTWDEGQKGSLRSWKVFAPGATTPAIANDFGYDAQGLRTSTAETLNLAGYPALTRQFARDYHLNGATRSTRYRDAVGGTNETTSLVTLDSRGLPQSIVLSRGGEPDQIVGVQTRNVAGLVTRRRTDLTSAMMPFIETNWSYDTLGRITSQVVQKAPGPTQVVRQDLTYFGNDDPKSLDYWLGATNRKHFDLSYDPRHQLVGVAETGGAFNATYAYGPAGRFTDVTHAAQALPGSDVRPRDVDYVYAGAHPEQLTALMNVDGSTFAKYEYDATGNQVMRCFGNLQNKKPRCTGEAMLLVYDGKDQLRRASRVQAGRLMSSEEYYYDAGGRRVATVKRDAGGSPKELIWWLGDTEAHYDDSGVIAHVYSHLTLGTPVARVDRRNNNRTVLEFQFHGHANNTLAAVGSDGMINASFMYAPFGEIIEATDRGGTVAGVEAHRRRMNDSFVDEISELGYYGLRYYDRTSMTWTQIDPATPDTSRSHPRRAQLYTFDLNNPLRYLDPDGAEALSVLERVGSPRPAEIDALGFNESTPYYQNHWRPNGNNQIQAAQSVVNATVKLFGLDNGTPYRVVHANSWKVDHGGALGSAIGGTIYISEVALAYDPVDIASTLVHEYTHAEGYDGEAMPRAAQMVAAVIWLKNGSITPERFAKLRDKIIESAKIHVPFAVDIIIRSMYMPLAMAWMPEMHQHPSLVSEAYRRSSTPFFQGLWGLERNPDGPAKILTTPQ